MMFLYLYCLFALTTSITAIYEILMPVLQTRRNDGFELENVFVVYVVFFILTTFVAPVIFLSCIIPSMGDRFKKSLYHGLFSEE
jgi:fucose permease